MAADPLTSLEQSAFAAAVRRARPTPSTALTASSSPLVRPTQEYSAQALTPLALQARRQGWQKRVLELARQVPEVAGGAAIVRGAADGVRLVATGGNAADRVCVQERLDEFDLGRAVELMWLTGEFYLAWPDYGHPYSLSVEEISPNKGGSSATSVRGPSGMVDMHDPFFRIWKPSNVNRWHATSPNEAALDLIDAMYLHQLADTAVATSRLAGAGILFWPTTRKSQPLRSDGEPEPGSQEEVILQFHDAAMQSIENRKSLDATIPFIFFYDPEISTYKPELLRIDKEDHASEYRERFEIYRMRYAAATELPIETQTGMGETNHFSAWAIREDKYHCLMPFFDMIATQVERRVIQEMYPNISIEVDAEKLIRKPDQTDVIMQALSLQIIEPAYAFELLGLDSAKALEYRKADYTSDVLPSTPSDMKVGGDRGGGKFRDRP